MPVWWKYADFREALPADAQLAHAERDLLRCLVTGQVRAMAGFAIFCEGPDLIRIDNYEIPRSAWSEKRALFQTLGKRLNYLPHANKLFNPRVDAPDGYDDLARTSWTLDAFNLVYSGQDLEREFSLLRKETVSPPPPAQQSRRGRKPEMVRWEQFAAALAVLLERGETRDFSNVSATHGAVADFLADRGHTNALDDDTVKTLIFRVGAWSKGKPYTDDADYG